ncbi:MAG TPA: xanthine dehydrogenase family protein subunit M [Candidatus Baltobacterales bacterium]|nr:xanthine dehydrogenase family protein subunit M [Candidatus Baltobacterales bacterium]
MERGYFEPRELKAALAALGEHPAAAIVAGGTDLVVAHRSGKKRLADEVLAIHRLKELEGIEPQTSGGLRIGALVTHAELEASSALRETWSAVPDASALVGSPATRNMGTIAGNICNASPAMELGSPLLVFDASVELACVSGTRRVSFAEFVTGPGQTARRPDEMLTAVWLPPVPPGVRTVSAYLRLEYRQAMEIAVVGAAVALRIAKDGACEEARIGLTAVAPTCVRALEGEAVLKGQRISPDLLERAAVAAAGSARPIDDVRAPAEYRQAMVPVIVRQALELALKRSGQTATGGRT